MTVTDPLKESGRESLSLSLQLVAIVGLPHLSLITLPALYYYSLVSLPLVASPLYHQEESGGRDTQTPLSPHLVLSFPFQKG